METTEPVLVWDWVKAPKVYRELFSESGYQLDWIPDLLLYVPKGQETLGTAIIVTDAVTMSAVVEFGPGEVYVVAW